MAAAGIRQSNDIDMLVSQQVFDNLKRQGWVEKNKGPKDNPLAHDVFEVHTKWDFSSYKPTLVNLLASADIIDGVPFASLEEVLKWKEASGRPKDLKDIDLINAYLAT